MQFKPCSYRFLTLSAVPEHPLTHGSSYSGCKFFGCKHLHLYPLCYAGTEMYIIIIVAYVLTDLVLSIQNLTN